MCGGFVVVHDGVDMFSEQFMLTDTSVTGLRSSYNVRPTQDHTVVINHGKNELREMRWGIIPSWSKEPRMMGNTFNARVETVDSKPMFRKPFRSQRCIVPASGYFEWKTTPHGKQPYYIHPIENEYLGFAGLFEEWGEGKDTMQSFTIITMPSRGDAAELHHRMPAVLEKDAYHAWLDREITEPEVIKDLLPTGPPKYEIYSVSKEANTAANNYPELIAPLPI